MSFCKTGEASVTMATKTAFRRDSSKSMMCDPKEKFEEWREWLFGEDAHSIQNQILNMIWDAAVFRSINEARKYAETDGDGEPQLNKMIHGFINHSFFRMQALAIRRMLDRRNDVVSLYKLINDIERNCDLLTRKNILTALDYPYDYEEGLRAFYEAISQHKSPGDLVKYTYSRIMHKNIDSLTETDLVRRSPNDTVRKELLVWLKERLETCEEIREYVNKFIAHSATPKSRAAIRADDIKITLDKLFKAHKVICETAQFVGLKLLYRSLGNFLVIPQYDQFEHFEKPWVPVSTLAELNDHWQEYDKETMSWKNWDWQKDFNEHAETAAEQDSG